MDRLAEISAQGDSLETATATTVDFEMFRPVLVKALGRPPFDPVLKFRMVRA